MSNINTVITSSLWKSSLGLSLKGSSATALDRLRQSFFQFRERAALLVGEIHRELPDLTVHDISHLDSLWEMGSLVAGAKYKLTPTEAFVLGGAILLHDAGMSLASYPDGVEGLKKEKGWDDAVTLEFKKELDRNPTISELKNPPDTIKKRVIASLLRNLHAQQAERLAVTSWMAKGETEPHFLIEDSEIRQSLGRIIGLIAHSHWWPIQRLESEFSRTLGAPHWCPNTWVIDPLKIACILRVSDASHIDGRRAPSMLRALRRPTAISDIHWKFQEKLQKPHVSEDALVYTSGYAFPITEAAAWWLCWDTLSMIDRELRQVDALLADKHQARFSARRVAGIESPERIVSFIPTDSWLPIDAQVQVSDVPKLVLKMGGSELYGKNLSVALRELIQNAADAVKARRIIEKRSKSWGKITARLGKDQSGEWLEVEDDGIGMSEQVLRRYLLDFGNSYWGSSLMLEEFPGLLADGMIPIGKYGIGFFSIFMLGSAVRVRTKRADASQTSTLVMEFNTGLTTRPVIRQAETSEILKDGGTAIRVWLTHPSAKRGGLLAEDRSENPISLAQLCRNVSPCLNVTLHSSEHGKEQKCLEAEDWTVCPPLEFLNRLPIHGKKTAKTAAKLERLSENIRILKNKNGEIVGRGYLESERFSEGYPQGLITVGGLKACNITGFVGVLAGNPKRASRDFATPIVEPAALLSWATEQAKLAAKSKAPHKEQESCASYVRRFGGETGKLSIGRFRDKWWTSLELEKERNLPDEIYLTSSYSVSDYEKLAGFKLSDNVFITESQSWSGILSDMHDHEWPGWPDKNFLTWTRMGIVQSAMIERTLGGLVIESIAKAWGLKLLDVLSNSNIDNYSTFTLGKLGPQSITSDGLVIRRRKIPKKSKNSAK